MIIESLLWAIVIILVLIIISSLPLYLTVNLLGGETSIAKVFFVNIASGIVVFAVKFFVGDIGGFVTFLINIIIYKMAFQLSAIKSILVVLLQGIVYAGIIFLLSFVGVTTYLVGSSLI